MCSDYNRTRPVISVLLAGMVFALSGCAEQVVKLVPVAGTVTVGGKKLSKGSVVLHPDADKGNSSLELPRGFIDAEGNYTIQTYAKGGVAPGWYKVAVTAADQPDPNNPYKFTFLLPKRYINHRTSDLEFEVVENPAPGAYNLTLNAE